MAIRMKFHLQKKSGYDVLHCEYVEEDVFGDGKNKRESLREFYSYIGTALPALFSKKCLEKVSKKWGGPLLKVMGRSVRASGKFKIRGEGAYVNAHGIEKVPMFFMISNIAAQWYDTVAVYVPDMNSDLVVASKGEHVVGSFLKNAPSPYEWQPFHLRR